MESYLLLKASLLTEGLRASLESLRGVGSLYKEQNHGLFGWDFENHVDVKYPDDFLLPDGTVVQFRMNSRSPYHVESIDGRLAIYFNDRELTDVSWIKRPGYYDRKTSAGNDMIKIGQVGGKDNMFFCYQNYCSHFAKNQQCAFCNLVSTSKTYGSVLRRKGLDDIGEVASAAWKEGAVRHVDITGGCSSPKIEVKVVSELLGSIRVHTGFDTIPGILLPSPAKGEAIDRYHEAGIAALGYSMEIWDEKYYKAICPGKAESTSHGEFIESIKKAVKVFGEGNIFVMFVMGLEPKETFLEGIRELSSLGVNFAPYIWAPNPGSKLWGHRTPFAEWYEETTLEAADIVRASGVPSGDKNSCYQCDGNTLLADALRLKGSV
jgi:hypothetical protein